VNRNSTLPIPIPSFSCSASWISFVAPSRGGTKLPESLWQAAVELARQHGVYPVAHPLRLDYMRLKKRLGGGPNRRTKAHKPAFVELGAPRSAVLEDCHLPRNMPPQHCEPFAPIIFFSRLTEGLAARLSLPAAMFFSFAEAVQEEVHGTEASGSPF